MVPHCHHFADRGFLAATLEYRTQVPLPEALADVRAGIQTLRENASSIGFDPQRLILLAASGGALLALLCALPDKKTPTPDAALFRPDALILFGPVTDTSARGLVAPYFDQAKEGKKWSPLARLPRRHLPPCLLFHGALDQQVPFEHSQRFGRLYARKRNLLRLEELSQANQRFYHFHLHHEFFEPLMAMSEEFLQSQHLSPHA